MHAHLPKIALNAIFGWELNAKRQMSNQPATPHHIHTYLCKLSAPGNSKLELTHARLSWTSTVPFMLPRRHLDHTTCIGMRRLRSTVEGSISRGIKQLTTMTWHSTIGRRSPCHLSPTWPESVDSTVATSTGSHKTLVGGHVAASYRGGLATWRPSTSQPLLYKVT